MMQNQSTKTLSAGYRIGHHLAEFDDCLDELRDNLAFFCDSVIAMLQVDAEVDHATRGGARIASEQMKRQVKELKAHSGRLQACLMVELATQH